MNWQTIKNNLCASCIHDPATCNSNPTYGCDDGGVLTDDNVTKCFMFERYEKKVAEEAGMYRIDDPNAKKIVVGKYTIIRQSENSIWIQTQDGEGAEFSDSSFESAIDKYFTDNF